jgi:site-specific DNA recombinase
MVATTTAKPTRRRRGASLAAEPGPRRIAIYTRRSTDDEHQPFSIEAQLKALKNYINSQPDWTLVLEFSDDASGATTDRPDLQRALRAAKAGRYDVLLVVRVDRFSRRLSSLLDLLHELDDAKVAFVSATEPFDTSTPVGRMLVQLLGVFAEFERETIIDRVISGMTAKASKGKWSGGTRPYGYYVDRDTHKLVPHETESPILRDIFRLYTQERLGTRAIANELNRRGVRNRSGKPWSGYTIARILDNPAYVGDIAYRDVYVADAHEPLIDRDTFNQARDIAKARADAHTQRAVSPGDYHLTGLSTCPDCGCKYLGTAATGRSRTYRYYTCFSRNRYGSAGCTGIRLAADAADQAVLQALHDFYTHAEPILANALAAAQQQFHDTHADRHAELNALTTQINTAQAAIDRYHQAFENGTMDDATAGPRIKDLRHKAEQLTARRDDLTDSLNHQPKPPTPDTLDRLRSYLAHALTEGTPGERKRAIEALIHEIRINDEGEVIPVFKIPGPGGALVIDDAAQATITSGSRNGAVGGAGGDRTHDLTDYESAALTAELLPRDARRRVWRNREASAPTFPGRDALTGAPGAAITRGGPTWGSLTSQMLPQ